MRIGFASLCSPLLLAVLAFAQAPPADPWRPADLMAPSELATRLKGAAGPKVFYVGFGILYRSKHIPGAAFTGPTAKQEGLEALRAAVIKLPRTEELAIYCGCCPWQSCPNIRPAFLMLRELGFRHVRVLDLPTSFLKDWIQKGYPVEP
ncbi:MAG TPA: rhodanese-like domain-containing protein [Bryobacteraceae bacterium]